MTGPCGYLDLIGGVRYEDMESLLARFSRLLRLSGTDECEDSVQYVMEQLKAFGVSCERYEFDGFFSDPVRSEFEIEGRPGLTIPSRPRSYSRNCPGGVRGEIIYDRSSHGNRLNGVQEREWFSQFRGKIVLGWNFYEDYVKKIESYGAVALVHIWPSDEDTIHEETVGPVWGTPTLDNAGLMPGIPVVGIKRKDGESLIQETERTAIQAVIRSWVETRVSKTSLPVASIPGRTKDFVLVSSHIDSWYEGVSDNAVGNALCLELARILAPMAGRMLRGVKIAWWPGHSNGRYMGSTWFCDHFWQELHDHCVAHLNVDSSGSLGGAVIRPRTTRLEGRSFTADLIEEFTGKEVVPTLDIGRGGDQSFWGTGIPFHILYRNELAPEVKAYASPGSGGGWWWHTEFDTLDKVDPELLLRDTRLHLATVFRLAETVRLPADFPGYFAWIKTLLQSMAEGSDPAFDFRPINAAMVSMEQKVLGALDRGCSDMVFNAITRIVGGTMNRLIQSKVGEYEMDTTFPAKPFPGLQEGLVMRKESTPQDTFLFAVTGFVRQRNRMIGEMRRIECELEALLAGFCCKVNNSQGSA